MDPITTAIMTALAQAAVQQGIPKYGMTQFDNVPQLNQGGLDFSQLVNQSQQQPSQLPQLQLRDPFRRTY